MNKKVSIVYRFMPQYRYDFFNKLRDSLLEKNIETILVYGKNKTVPKKDEVDINWGIPVPNRIIKLVGQVFYWQPIPKLIYDADLIVLMQENRILNNYVTLLRSAASRKKIALWGHGLNLQDDSRSLGNRFKKIYTNRVFWWFAYTKGVAEIVAKTGFPTERITVVNNAIDTLSLIEHSSKIESREELRKEMNIGEGPVGIYCGAMYKGKRIDFLLDVCIRLREITGNFEMIFLGEGDESWRVKSYSEKYNWIHYPGPVFGLEKVQYFKVSDVFLIPGLVGLAILDSFALEVPLITTDSSCLHSPEIEYLVDGHNGIITPDTFEEYVNGVLRVINEPVYMETLKANCRESAKFYTLENMVSNFAEGVVKALSVES